jgi:hypothetical protein
MLNETYELGGSEGSRVHAVDSEFPTNRGEQTITVDVLESEASASQTYREGACHSVIADFGDGDVDSIATKASTTVHQPLHSNHSDSDRA